MQPTTAQWSDLYNAATEFKQAASWKWMRDIHLFGVKHPDYPLVGYCSVLGRAGEMFGLAVYLGSAGLRTLLDMMSGKLTEDPFYLQHCLMLSFDDREDLHPMERAKIKELGLKFRGKQAWPSFRLHEPGFYPWPLQKAEEAVFLTAAIEQAIEVSHAAKGDPDTYLAWGDNGFRTRVGTREPDGRLSWRTEWLEPEEASVEAAGLPSASAASAVDELRLAKLKKSNLSSAGAWELGCFYMPQPIMGDDGRPYFPMLFLVVDQNSGQILTMELRAKAEIAGAAAAKFLALVEQTGRLPSELVALKELPLEILQPIVESFGIPCFLAPSLPSLEEAQAGILGGMG